MSLKAGKVLYFYQFIKILFQHFQTHFTVSSLEQQIIVSQQLYQKYYQQKIIVPKNYLIHSIYESNFYEIKTLQKLHFHFVKYMFHLGFISFELLLYIFYQCISLIKLFFEYHQSQFQITSKSLQRNMIHQIKKFRPLVKCKSFFVINIFPLLFCFAGLVKYRCQI